MFLTKKSLRKIRTLVTAYYIIGLFCLVVYGIFSFFYVEGNFLLILGVLCFILGVIFRSFGRYAEGKGILINQGNKLIFHELRPAEFIRLYEEKKNCPDNVIAKDDFDVLMLVFIAYDSMGQTELALETLDRMFLLAPEKKKTYVKLLKASELFGAGMVEEGEKLYAEAIKENMDMMTKSTADLVLKSDRAVAMKDYVIAENFFKERFNQKFPKITPLVSLVTHYYLAKIYLETNKEKEAEEHLNYCIKNGGETTIKDDALNLLSRV